ncbi:heme utilization protein [Streptomyces cellulosae]|uniref:heme utilization protein n=1 Tax=Streptomyces cellulosae TaxID=1968 RepID=UPI00131CA982|nr:heme utilization protein [Streptomyces cellulosae]
MTDIRYGIFLRPDPATCWAVTQVTLALNKQFGLVSAGAFPPHATLIGNLCTRATETELISALDPVFEKVAPFPVHNSGISRTGSDTYEYDVNLDASGTRPNEPLCRVAAAVAKAVEPLSVPVDDHLVTPVADYAFAAHLALASHDLLVDNRLTDEVGEFLAGLPVQPPASFVARWYSLFEFRADWSGRWWQNMSWRHLHSWEVT